MVSQIALVAATALSSTTSWFGFTLGEPLPFAECARTAGEYHALPVEPNTPCFMNIEEPGKFEGSLEIHGANLPPEYLNQPLVVVVLEEKLQALFIITKGVAVQEKVYEDIAKHVGPAPAKSLVKGSFTVESEVKVVQANWKSPELLIDLIGGFGTVETGMLRIRTPLGERFEMSEFAKAKRKAGA
jgi:hypothetical protein